MLGGKALLEVRFRWDVSGSTQGSETVYYTLPLWIRKNPRLKMEHEFTGKQDWCLSPHLRV